MSDYPLSLFKLTLLCFIFLLMPLNSVASEINTLENEIPHHSSNNPVTNPEVSLLDSIPKELLSSILVRMDKKDIPSLTRLNKKWKMIMEEDSLWEQYASKPEFYVADLVKYKTSIKDFIKNYYMPKFEMLDTKNSFEHSYAYGINKNGSVVVGVGDSDALKWTFEKGVKSLGPGTALKVSGDGSIIVGRSNGQACKWTQESDVSPLFPADAALESVASDISEDGTFIVGYIKKDHNTEQQGYRWDNINQTGTILDVPQATHSVATRISKDGSTITGWSATHKSLLTWNAGLQAAEIRNTCTFPEGINQDGSVIVGQVNDNMSAISKRAFMYKNRKLVPLSDQPGSVAYAVNSDGSVIVGSTGGNAFRWTKDANNEAKTELIKDLLASYKIEIPANCRLTEARAVSANGLIIAGRLIQANKHRAWRAVIPKKH